MNELINLKNLLLYVDRKKTLSYLLLTFLGAPFHFTTFSLCMSQHQHKFQALVNSYWKRSYLRIRSFTFW
jgi:hypothetical protein